jgi:hypothetical protein
LLPVLPVLAAVAYDAPPAGLGNHSFGDMHHHAT